MPHWIPQFSTLLSYPSTSRDKSCFLKAPKSPWKFGFRLRQQHWKLNMSRASLGRLDSSSPLRDDLEQHRTFNDDRPNSTSSVLGEMDAGDEEAGDHDDNGSNDGLTPLDATLEKIGVGPYQWRLLVLCGFGWMTDNMWLQSVAVILPRVQVHFGVSDQWIGVLSASIFTGMMIGAWTWGSFSDSFGRVLPFNATLILTAICGLASAFATSFSWLCFSFFLLGIGVGGSMPTDGTLFLENTPRSRHYLLTGLSFFFSLGAVIASLLGLVILPTRSCVGVSATNSCDPEKDNYGWRYMLISLGLLTFAFFLARVVLFRLHESPKYLVASGRGEEAVTVLKHISKFNGRPMSLSATDVLDDEGGSSDFRPDEGRYVQLPTESSGTRRNITLSRTTSAASLRPKRRGWRKHLPVAIVGGLNEVSERVSFLFTTAWAKTTILVWMIWTSVSFGYTCFNVFLPKFLEQKLGSDGAGGGGLEESLKDYLIYTASGCPGSFLGAWLIETRLGRRYSMALATLLTALGTFVFVGVSTQSGVVLSSMLISLMATLMYAVIYGYTPEVFPPQSRGTACGIASALSRLAGIVAPLLTGALLTISPSLPLYVSAGVFLLSCLCMVALPIETRNGHRN